MEEKKEKLFIILPYLKTSSAVNIRGVTFRNSSDIDNLDSETKENICILLSMFFLKDNLQIKEMSYALLEIDKNSKGEILQILIEIHELIAYLYSSPHPTFLNPFLTKEHANLYIFRLKQVSQYILWPDNNVINVSPNIDLPIPDKRREVPAYEGSINNESVFWVAKGSRIYPPSTHFWLNIPQDLCRDIEMRLASVYNRSLNYLIKGTGGKSREVENRIFTALKWYNRSVSIDVSDDVAILSLAVAFESLLGLEPGEKVTKRFKEAVTILVGPINKLDSWLDQFYDIRSDIVHEGNSENYLFIIEKKNKKNGSKYRSLVSYGRLVFKICLGSIIYGSEIAHQIGLSSIFITNKERFQRICKYLTNNTDNPTKAILSVRQDIIDIDAFKFVPEDKIDIETILSSLKYIFKAFIDTTPQMPDDIISYMNAYILENDDTYYEQLYIIEKLSKLIESDVIYKNNKREDDLFYYVSLLIKVTWEYTFMYYYKLIEDE